MDDQYMNLYFSMYDEDDLEAVHPIDDCMQDRYQAEINEIANQARMED